MRKHFSLGIVLLKAVVFIALLAACGGGGGGTTLKNYYSGEPGAASITNSAEAEAIALEAYEHGALTDAAEFADPMGSLAAKSLSLTSEALKAAASQTVEIPSVPSDTACTDNTGNITYTVSASDSGSFSMTVKFNNFCEESYGEEEYINGSVKATGSVDAGVAPPELKSMTLTITSMNGKAYDAAHELVEDVSLSGKVTMSVTGATATTTTTATTMNMTAKDNISGESFKVENYNASVTEDTSAFTTSTTITSGKFYHSDFGYVSVATESPLVKSIWEANPTSGVMVFTGDGWSAKLDFGTGNIYTATLSVDLDGDETYEEGPLTVDLDAGGGGGYGPEPTAPPVL